MEYLFYLVMLSTTFFLGVCLSNLIRLNILSNLVTKLIGDTYDNRMRMFRTQPDARFETICAMYPYPDIDATYANFKFLTFWRTPSSCIVYEKELI